MADNKIIHQLLKEVRDNQKEADERAREHREESVKQHADMTSRLDRYNDQLEIHIEGVKALKTLHNDNVQRIEALEKPSKSFKYIGGIILKCGGIAGAIAAIIKLSSLI